MLSDKSPVHITTIGLRTLGENGWFCTKRTGHGI